MPHSFRLFLDLKGEGPPAPAHLRAFAAEFLERDVPSNSGGHYGHVKPYTVGRCVQLAPRIWSLDIATATDRTTDVLLARATDGVPVFLGRLSGAVVGSPVELLERSWADLANSPQITGLQMSFDTPTVFKHEGAYLGKPTGQRIFGHLRRRWRNLDPDTSPDGAFDAIDFDVHLDGTRVPIKGASTGGGVTDAFGGRKASGFVEMATIAIDGASVDDQYAFGALAGAVPFLGCGAWTTSGFGATSLLAFWVDD